LAAEQPGIRTGPPRRSITADAPAAEARQPMSGRYDKLADPSPSFDELYFLLICARPTRRQRMEDPDTTETLRKSGTPSFDARSPGSCER
jgi:hypothetical protein